MEVVVFKKAFFLILLAGCFGSKAPIEPSKAGLQGYAGENFSTTNSPCFDGVLAAMDSSCAVPIEIEEGYPYVMVNCASVRSGANPWDKYLVIILTNQAIREPEIASMICADPYARVYIQERP